MASEVSMRLRMGGGRGDLFSLAGAGLADYALQFLLPVLLVRLLDPVAYGQYRFVWLLAGSTMAIAPFFMPHSLFYWLPRSAAPQRRQIVANTVAFMGCTAALAALTCSPLNPLLPEAVRLSGAAGWLAAGFVALWVLSSLLDHLPNAAGRVPVQAKINLGFALLRSALLGAAAWLGGFTLLLWALALFAVMKIVALMWFAAREFGPAMPRLAGGAFKAQLAYAAPFALAGGFFLLRSQADQWIVASLFSSAALAIFSVALTLAPFASLVRQTVNNAWLPRIGACQAAGDTEGMLAWHRRAGAAVSFVLMAGLGFAFAFAPELVDIVFTPTYHEGAGVMRVCIVGLLAQAIEVNALLRVLSLGGFQMRLNAVFLMASLAVSLAGAHAFGMAGAALGSAASLLVAEAITVGFVSRRLGQPVSRLLDLRTTAACLAAAVMAGGVAWYVASLAGDSMTKLLVGAPAFLAAYLALTYVARAIPVGLTNRGAGA